MLLPFLGMTLAVLAISYLLGMVTLQVARFRGGERYFRLFLALTTGLTLLISTYALFVSRGLTILMPVLGLMVALVVGMRTRFSTAEGALQDAGLVDDEDLANTSGSWQPLGVLLATALLLFGIRFGLLYDAKSPFLLTPFQDYIFYGRLSMPLNQLGLETRSLEQFYPQFLQRDPYHYYELWLNALLVRLSGQPAVWCLYLSTYTVMTTVVYAGFRALLAHFGWRGAWAAALALLLFSVSGVYWPAFEHHPFASGGRYVAISLLLLEPKLCAIYIFLLLSVLVLLQRRWRAGALALAVLPLVFVTTLPAVAGGLVALGVGLRRQLSKWRLLGLLVPLVMALVYMAVFYGLQPAAYHFPTATGTSLAAQLPHLSELRTLINIFAGTLINVALYVGPYVLLLLMIGWGYFRAGWQRWPYSITILVVGFAIVAVVGAAARTLAVHLPDSYQLLGNILPPFIAVVVGGILAMLLTTAGNGRRALALVGLLALAWVNHRRLLTGNHSMHGITRFSPAFLQQVRSALGQTSKKGGFMLADADYETVYNLTSDTFTCGTYVSNFTNDYALVSLSALDIAHPGTDLRFTTDTTAATAYIGTSSFVRFVKMNALRGRHWPKDSAQYQFVVQQKLGFLCVAPAAVLPATLQPLVQHEYRDSLSGEKFFVLKNI